MTDIPVPARGRLTFDAEGQEGGPWHSRHFHVPDATSGLIIGRGYDSRIATTIKRLCAARSLKPGTVQATREAD
jgi:hypothetical protein